MDATVRLRDTSLASLSRLVDLPSGVAVETPCGVRYRLDRATSDPLVLPLTGWRRECLVPVGRVDGEPLSAPRGEGILGKSMSTQVATSTGPGPLVDVEMLETRFGVVGLLDQDWFDFLNRPEGRSR